MPILSCLFAIEAFAGILKAPTFIWNEIRLSRSLAFFEGFPLYPGERELGPIIGTLHPPISHFLFLSVVAIRDPTASIVAGSVLAFIVVFSAFGFALVRSTPQIRGRWAIAGACFLFGGFLIIESEGAYNAVFSIHTDAAALAFATVACTFAASRKEMTTASVWVSAGMCALAVASKQTIAPVVLAIALYIAIREGGKRFAQFLLAGVVTGGLLVGFLLLILPPRAFLFNTLALAAHRPFKPNYIEILAAAYRMERLEALPALLPFLFLAICSWITARPRPKIRHLFAAHFWIVFAMASAALMPVSMKAIVSVGADVNHLGFVLYFLFVAAALAIQQNYISANSAAQLSARIFLIIGILVSAAPGVILTVPAGLGNLTANPSQTAYSYNLRHPGLAYFPYNPMASLLTERKLYDLDTALYDREIAGYPLTPQQLQSGLPRSFSLVALPPGIEGLQSKALQRLFADSVRVSDPELPEWTIYKRAP